MSAYGLLNVDTCICVGKGGGEHARSRQENWDGGGGGVVVNVEGMDKLLIQMRI